MSNVTIEQFAETVGIPVERFLIVHADPLGETHFLFAGYQRKDADVAQVLVE
jgi:hypothetical protein